MGAAVGYGSGILAGLILIGTDDPIGGYGLSESEGTGLLGCVCGLVGGIVGVSIGAIRGSKDMFTISGDSTIHRLTFHEPQQRSSGIKQIRANL